MMADYHKMLASRVGCQDLIIADLSRAAPADQAIYGEWSGATHHKGREAGEIQQTHFVAWRSELRSCRGYGHELDRAKTVWQVHRKQRYQQDSRHRDAGNRHKRARKDSKAPAQFNEYRCPCHEMGRWNTQGLENSGKCIRSFGKLGVPVLHEAVSNNEAQGNRRPSGERKSSRHAENKIKHFPVLVPGRAEILRA